MTAHNVDVTGHYAKCSGCDWDYTGPNAKAEAHKHIGSLWEETLKDDDASRS